MSAPQPPVAAIVLAGGASTRLGRPKQLLDLGGRPLLQRTLDHALASSADRVLLVLGANAPAILAALDLGRATVIENPDWAAGQSTSLHAGLAALPPEIDAALFMLGDQPLIRSTALDALLDAYRRARPPIVMPTYDGEPGNPVLFDRALWPELAAIEGDLGARDVVRAHRDQIHRVPITDGSRPDDVDDDAAYERVRAAWDDGSGSRSENKSGSRK